MGTYETLGVRRVINADARLTKLGGSLMPPEELAAMAGAEGRAHHVRHRKSSRNVLYPAWCASASAP
jgi:hypothetical protein